MQWTTHMYTNSAIYLKISTNALNAFHTNSMSNKKKIATHCTIDEPYNTCAYAYDTISKEEKKNTPHNQAQQVGKKKITPLEKVTNMPIHTAKVCSSHFMVNQILAPNGHFCSKHKFWPPSLKPPQYALYKSAIARHAHVRVTTTISEKQLIQSGSTKQECIHP